MGYPKSMYKGGYTADEITAEHKIVTDEAAEKALRKKGFIDGKELFSKPPVEAGTGFENVYQIAMAKANSK